MTKEEYLRYLMSDEWRERAEKRLEIDGYTCQACGTRGTPENKLQIHHLNYKHLGHEDPYTDLVCLCAICHRNTHSLLNRITDRNGGRMWNRHEEIPKIHVYTISGLETLTEIDDTTTEQRGKNGTFSDN